MASTFSTLTLTGPRIPNTISLSGSYGFPSPRYDIDRGYMVYRREQKWQSPSSPEGAGHLSLRMRKRISEGRSAVVYAVDVLSTTSGENGLTSSSSVSLEGKLCVKIARPSFCRTLAREAWMYDQLDSPDGQRKLQGVIAPRFYGFFTAQLSSGRSSFPPWATEEFEVPTDGDCAHDDRLPGDDLLEEMYDGVADLDGDEQQKVVERPQSADILRWLKWRPDFNAPLLAIIVMSRGGRSYTTMDENRDTRSDVNQVLDDLSRASVVHGDLRVPNLIRAPANALPCEMHHCVHKWNVIDFAWAHPYEFDDDDPQYHKKRTLMTSMQKWAYGGPKFYGEGDW